MDNRIVGIWCTLAIAIAVLPLRSVAFCPEFNCPDECEVTYYHDGCPKNCNCKKPRYNCPFVKCPHPEPNCLVRTRLDGCQECVCKQWARLPVAQSTATGTDKEIAKQHQKSKPKPPPKTKPAPAPKRTSTKTKSATKTTSKVSSKTSTNVRPAQNKVARPRPAPRKSSKECDAALKREVDKQMAKAFEIIKSNKAQGSPAYPLMYSIAKAEIQNTCAAYKNGLKELTGKTVRLCRSKYPAFDEALANFEYPCGNGIRQSFERKMDCIIGKKNDPKVQECESQVGGTPTASSACSKYNQLTECLYDAIRPACKADGWELHFQFLSLFVRQYDNDCRLSRIFRAPKRSSA